MSKAAKIAIFIIKAYRNYLSYLKLPSCRYCPSCSEYAISCLENLSLFKAIVRILWRILRCNPFAKGGFDPVNPDRDRLSLGERKVTLISNRVK